MAFGKLVLIAAVGVVLYTGGLPDPLNEFFLKVKEAFLFMGFRTMVTTTKLCLSHADKLQEIGQSVCDGLCPAYGPPNLVYKQQAAFSGAHLLRQLGNFLNAQGVEYLSNSFGETVARFTMWLLVKAA